MIDNCSYMQIFHFCFCHGMLWLRYTAVFKTNMSTENSSTGNNLKMVDEQNIRVQERSFSRESCSVTAYCRINSHLCTNWLLLITGYEAWRFSGMSLTSCLLLPWTEAQTLFSTVLSYNKASTVSPNSSFLKSSTTNCPIISTDI